jgi:steroid 5-alpha reductase family enzyme
VNKLRTVIKKADFVHDKMLCFILLGHWCKRINVNMYEAKKDKNDDVKYSFMVN